MLQLLKNVFCERTKRFSFVNPPLPPPQKKRGALRQIYRLFSLHRSNKQQEKDKKFQRIQTEHIKS